MGTIVTGGVLLGAVGCIIRGMVTDKKKDRSFHCSGCCKNCSHK